MPRWSKEDLENYTARRSGRTNEVHRAVAEIVATDPGAKIGIIGSKGMKVIERSDKKPKLNKLERDFEVILKQRHSIVHSQAITFRLAESLTYRPDFVAFESGLMIAYETKGKHRFREKGVIKLRFAAKEFHWVKFVLVERNGGVFTEQIISNE